MVPDFRDFFDGSPGAIYRLVRWGIQEGFQIDEQMVV
jgi:hypothetical protein